MDLLSPNWTSLWLGFNNTPSDYLYLTYFLDFIIFIVFFIIIIILQKLSNVLQYLFTGNITEFENFVRVCVILSIKHCDKYDAKSHILSLTIMIYFQSQNKIKVSATEARLFWLSLIICQIIWIIFIFGTIFKLDLKWFVSI